MSAVINGVKYVVKKSPKLSHLYRVVRDNYKSNSPLKLTSYGFRFLGNSDMENGTFEPDETALVRRLLEGCSTFINVGANIGYYCCHALSAGKSVLAVEPMQGNLYYLYRNIQENGWAEKISVYPMALADSPKVLTIYGGGTGASLLEGWAGVPSSYRTSIACTTFDLISKDLPSDEPILVVIDVEGAESKVLAGAMGALDRLTNASWLIEICIDEHQPNGRKVNPELVSTFNIFWDRGYKSFLVGKNLREVTRSEIRKIEDDQINHLDGHNFLFVR
jgi:FkbM family methyltransferase